MRNYCGRRIKSLRGKWFVFTALILMALVLPVSAQEAEGSFRLNYQSIIDLPISKTIQVDTTDVVFKNEPNFRGHTILRNILAGAKGESTALYFACDLDAQQFYIDLNRNLDLTDDPSGVISYKTDHPAHIKGFNLTVPQQGGNVTYSLGMRCYKLQNGVPYINVFISSGWVGKITLGSKTYWVALKDMPDGTFGVNGSFFMSEWTDGMTVRDVSKDPYGEFSGIPHRLFLEGKCYELGYTYVPGEAGNTDLILTVKPTDVSLGTLALEGENLRRVVLRDKLNGPVCVVMDHPGPIVQVPVGNYEAVSVILTSDEQERYRLKGDLEKEFTVAAEQPASIQVGAPIKAVLSSEIEWRQILLDLKYIGVGGEKYALTGPGAHCVIRQKGKEIADCKFSYG